MSYVRGYQADDSGALRIVDLAEHNGGIYHSVLGELTPKGKTVALQGWPDSSAQVYQSEHGHEVLVANA